MRIWLVIGLVVAMAFVHDKHPSEPIPVSASQLPSLLQQFGGQHDRAFARSLLRYQLEERLCAKAKAALENELPGPHSRAVFLAFADESKFQPSSTDARAQLPPPDSTAQVETLEKLRQYAAQITKRLPNLSALRSTTYFMIASEEQAKSMENAFYIADLNSKAPDIIDLGQTAWDPMPDAHLYLNGTWDGRVSYTHGSEMEGPTTHIGSLSKPLNFGLVTHGEFSNVLSVVTEDAVKGNIEFARWEKSDHGVLAIYSFKVPKESSHFSLGLRDSAIPGMLTEPTFTSYHGELSMLPESGVVYRISIFSDHQAGDPPMDLSETIEYGEVEIGGQRYICPLDSVTLSKTFTSERAYPQGPYFIFLNHVSFSNYRLFRSDWKLIVPNN